MRCQDCDYLQIIEHGEDDFELECDSPNGRCPYLKDCKVQAQVDAILKKRGSAPTCRG